MFLRYFLILTALIIVAIGITPIFMYYYFASDLKDKESIMNKKDVGIILFDRNNKPFFKFYEAKQKVFAPLNEISKYLQQAAIASEDKDFYHHPGFSIRGIIRSVYLNYQKKELVYGGSTITQQLVKNSLLNSEKSFLRKYQEIVLASEIERRYSKKEILTMYLNSVYFGEGAFGAEEAAQVYFGKHASDLSLSESAFIIGLLPAPSDLSPYTGDFNRAKVRQKIVLQKMLDEKYINKKEKITSENEQLVFQDKEEINSIGTHFALMVRNELIQKYGEEKVIRSGFKVKTSIDLNWQQYAEEVVRDQVEKLRVNNVSNGAAVVLDPKTGEIKALVGSKDWHDDQFGKFNIIISARQPGSSFKPVVYSKALEERLITPATILHDQPTTYIIDRISGESYSPRNYDGGFRGLITTRRALANSLNVPAVEVMSKIGVPAALEMAERLGISTLDDHSRFGLSLALGAGEVKPLELTNVYATFANYGEKNEPTAILEIKNKYTQTIYTYKPYPKRILDPEVAFLISSILSDNKARSEIFGSALTISRLAAVKTGTTENYKDAWTLGYTPSLAIGVWVGNNDGRVMDNIAGSLGAAPIWKALMEKFLENTPIEEFIPPQGIISSVTCILKNDNPKTASVSAIFSEYFIEGTEPSNICSKSRSISPTFISISPVSSITINSPTSTVSLQPTLAPTITVITISTRPINTMSPSIRM